MLRFLAMMAFGIACIFVSASVTAQPKYTGAPAARMVFYSGEVQGVGFRATAERIAQNYPVTGWVKNLNDGRVQLLAEGPGDAVQAFLTAIRTRWKDNIKKEEASEEKVSGKFKKFAVVE